MSYGMDFEYENYGSKGEKIFSHESGIAVSNQEGKIYFQCAAPVKIYEESDDKYEWIAQEIEKELISQTASF